jgi:hypothetical protein
MNITSFGDVEMGKSKAYRVTMYELPFYNKFFDVVSGSRDKYKPVWTPYTKALKRKVTRGIN